MLAAKCALSVRADALGDASGITIALTSRAKVEARLDQMEGGVTHSLSRSAGKPEQKTFVAPVEVYAIFFCSEALDLPNQVLLFS